MKAERPETRIHPADHSATQSASDEAFRDTAPLSRGRNASRYTIQMKRYQQSAGFSLIEALLVVAIVGVLASLAGSELEGLRMQNDAHRSAQEILEYLREARSLARSLGEDVIVQTSDKTLIITPAGEAERRYETTLTLGLFSSSSGTLTFKATGATDQADPIVLSATSENGSIYQYVIYPAIGTVRML